MDCVCSTAINLYLKIFTVVIIAQQTKSMSLIESVIKSVQNPIMAFKTNVFLIVQKAISNLEKTVSKNVITLISQI